MLFPTVHEPIRKDLRPIFGRQTTSWGPPLSISLIHMCMATLFISCIIHKHTHNFWALSSTSAFALQKHHAVQRCMAFSWPHHGQCGLGETECEEKDMWAQNIYRVQKQTKKSIENRAMQRWCGPLLRESLWSIQRWEKRYGREWRQMKNDCNKT